MFAALNGTHLYFDVEGSGYVPNGDTMKSRPICIVLHGGPGSDHADFKPWLSPLAEQMQIIYLDQRSNGQSERVDPATCSLEQLADDIEALRQYLGLGKIYLLGHSFGGMIAQVYATKYAESLNKLILVCTASSSDFYPAALEYVRHTATPQQLRTIPELFEGRIEDEQHLIRWWDTCLELYFHQLDEQIIKEVGNRPIGSLEVLNYTFKHFIPTYDVRSSLPALNIQTLIIGARYDWITPVSQAEEIHLLLPNSELVLFEHSGHMPFIEENDDFIKLVSSFIAKEGLSK
ncbi:MAG: alpha/beta fold hydrolase [Gorillibacterium sp.]|nr:alpha/beta fold hydrolase [Gorillibacterium sp.]